MKILIIGSTGYRERFKAEKTKLESSGHTVLIPGFDDQPFLNELALCEHNRLLMKEADEVRVIWDGRSVGTVFDFGMVFAMRKPVRIVYIEPKTIAGVMRRYAATFKKADRERRVKRAVERARDFLPIVEDGKIHFTREALIFIVIATALLWWLIFYLGTLVGGLL